MELSVALSNYFVGPRQGLTSRAQLYFALQVAGTLTREPPDPQAARQIAPQLLPWSLMKPNLQLRGFLFSPAKTPAEVTVSTQQPQPSSAFVSALQSHIEARTRDLLDPQKSSIPVKFAWAGDNNTQSKNDSLVWPALAQTLATLPPPLSNACLASWYAEINTDQLFDSQGAAKGGALVIAPASLINPENGAVLSLVAPTKTDWSNGAVVALTYQSEDGSIARQAYTPGLDLAGLPTPYEKFSLDTYWMQVSDARDKSLANVDQQVMKALDPEAWLGFVQAENVQSIALLDDGTPAGQPLTSALAAQFLDYARTWARSQKPDSQDVEGNKKYEASLRSQVAGVLGDLKHYNGSDPVVGLYDAVRKQAGAWWVSTAKDATTRLQTQHLIKSTQSLKVDPVEAGALVDPLLNRVLPSTSVTVDAHPVLPGEGIDFTAGAPETRLVHEDHPDADAQGALMQNAGVGVLIRRATDKGKLDSAPWRIVTAGVPVIDPQNNILTGRPWGMEAGEPKLPHAPEVLLRGLQTGFVGGVLRSDYSYFGAAMSNGSPLAFTHRQSSADAGAAAADNGYSQQRLAYLSIESPAPLQLTGDRYWAAPALRYGDWYDIRAFVSDRVGGIPAELSVPGKPWAFRPESLSTLSVSDGKNFPTQFLRRVAVGEINITPGAAGLTADQKSVAAWQKVPTDVSLRCREWLRAKNPANSNVPLLLLGPKSPASILLSGAAGFFSFSIEPPRLDEHTLQRWLIPAGGSTTAGTELSLLRKELKRIYTERDNLLSSDPPPKGNDAVLAAQKLLPHDPAVVGILFRITTIDAQGAETSSAWRLLEPPAGDVSPFIRKTILVNCRAADQSSSSDADLDIPVAEGTFAYIEFQPAVEAASFSARFDAIALHDLFDPAPVTIGTRQLIAFGGSGVLVECATVALPTPEALFDAFNLRVNAHGAVIAAVKALTSSADKPSNWAFVDGFTLDRQRWIWRNVPLTDPTGPLPSGQLCTDLPQELADPALRDTADAVLKFDLLASIDRGLVDRGTVQGQIPRGPNGAVLASPDLYCDERDAVVSADYLRYRLGVRSRYAALLGDRGMVWAAGPGSVLQRPQAQWRRIVADFRGDASNIKAVKVLAVLPLTKSPTLAPDSSNAPPPTSAQGTPFVVVIDEPWYREYGQGESLQTRIVLDSREIGDAPEGSMSQRPFRVGPLPDHWDKPADPQKKYYHGATSSDATEDPTPTFTLEAFGPFGFSLDRSGNEALANATAFVLYLPKDIGPHWSVFVQMRRVLRGLRPIEKVGDPPFVEKAGPWSDTHPLYTIAGSTALCRQEDFNLASTLRLVKKADGAYAVFVDNLVLDLTPLAPEPAAKVSAQYRYVLLVGPLASDGGRGVDVFLPSSAYWLSSDTATALSSKSKAELSPRLAGRVLEIRLNGKYPDGVIPDFDTADSLRQLFENLLPAPQSAGALRDGQGMVTRVSQEFSVLIDDGTS